MQTRILNLSTAALLCAGAVTAQSARPIALTNARIHTVSGALVEKGTVIVRSGKIEAVGDDVTIPAGAKVCLLYTSPSPRDQRGSRMPSSA